MTTDDLKAAIEQLQREIYGAELSDNFYYSSGRARVDRERLQELLDDLSREESLS